MNHSDSENVVQGETNSSIQGQHAIAAERIQGQHSIAVERIQGQHPIPAERIQGQHPIPAERKHPKPAESSWPGTVNITLG